VLVTLEALPAAGALNQAYIAGVRDICAGRSGGAQDGQGSFRLDTVKLGSGSVGAQPLEHHLASKAHPSRNLIRWQKEGGNMQKGNIISVHVRDYVDRFFIGWKGTLLPGGSAKIGIRRE
jgi:hypothetical protein